MCGVGPQNFGAGKKNNRHRNFGAGGTDDFMNFYYNSMKFYL